MRRNESRKIWERETSTCIAFLISSSMGGIFSTTVVYVKFESYRACRRSFCPISIIYNAFLNPLSSIRSLLPIIKTNMYKVLITTRHFIFVINDESYLPEEVSSWERFLKRTYWRIWTASGKENMGRAVAPETAKLTPLLKFGESESKYGLKYGIFKCSPLVIKQHQNFCNVKWN